MRASRRSSSSDSLRGHTPRHDIQGLRALAVIVVVAFHAGLPIPGGFVGVDIFFVISGYVITGMLLRELQAHDTIRFGRFFGRRIKRLLPALTLVVLVTLSLSFLIGSPFDQQQTTTALTGFGAMVMSANAVIFLTSGGYFAVPPTNNPLLNTWSLSVEEQFYLVFPLLLLLLWVVTRKVAGVRRRSQVMILGIGLVALASFALAIVFTYDLVPTRLTDPDWFAFYASPTRAWEFAIGSLTYLVTSGRRFPGTSAVPASVVFWVGLAGIVTSVLVVTEDSAFPGVIALLPVLSTALVLSAGSHSPIGVRILTNRPAVYLGDASYSWYLWHWPLIAFTVALFPAVEWVLIVAAVGSLGLAAATLRWLENPIRFSEAIAGWRTVGLAAVCVGSVGVAALALYAGATNAWGRSDIRNMIDQVSATHLWQSTGCNSGVPLGQRPDECRWNPSGAGAPIVLAGDSMAGQLSEGALGAGQLLDRPVLAGTRGACPFIGLDMLAGGSVDEACNVFVRDSAEWLVSQAPLDIVLSSSLGYTVLDGVEFKDPVTGEWLSETGAKTRAYVGGLEALVRSLTQVGHRVTVVLPPPGFPRTVMDENAWRPSQCMTIEALLDVASCGAQRSEEDVIAETEALFTAMRDAVNRAGGQVIDLRSAICAGGTCATNTGDDWLYLDGSHLSVSMSERLAAVLADAVREKG